MKRIVRIGQTAIGIVGVLSTFACIAAMVLAAIGIAGVGASTVGAGASMAGMSTGSQGQAGSFQATSILAFLLQAGPTILPVSIGAFTLSLAIRQWATALPVLLAGGVIYWGMYGQRNLSVMYVTIVLGLFCWAVVFLWVREDFLCLRRADEE